MTLAPGVTDPLFTHELALELGMTVGELGDRMSAHELTVAWPAYFAYRNRVQQKAQEEANQRSRRI